MSALTLTLRQAPAQGVDCSPLTPDALAGRSKAEIEKLELACGARRIALGELFKVEGRDAATLVLRGSGERLTHLGAGMKAGSLAVEGDCGPWLGLGMLGGRISVSGRAAAYAGSGMRGGMLDIGGDAGDFLGAAVPGERQGLRGGTIVVRGNAGARLGDRMRRGLILVKGDAGAYCGARMLAGTVVIGGAVGEAAGLGLKRGTLLLSRAPREFLASFRDSGVHTLLFLHLLEKALRGDAASFGDFLPLPRRVRRYCGDLATGGAGEILLGA